MRIAQADGGEVGAPCGELLLVRAQLRDVFAAEDSAVMAQKDDYRRTIVPERAQPHRLAVGVG